MCVIINELVITPKQIKIYLQEVNDLELEEQLEKYFQAGGKAEGLEGVLQEKYFELYAEGYTTDIKISETENQNISKDSHGIRTAGSKRSPI